MASLGVKKSHGIGYGHSWGLVLLSLTCSPINGSALKALRAPTHQGAEGIITQSLSNGTYAASVTSAASSMEDRWYLTPEGTDMMHKQEHESPEAAQFSLKTQMRQNQSSGVPANCKYPAKFTVLWWPKGIFSARQHSEYGPELGGKYYCDVSCVEPASSEPCQDRADGIVYHLPTNKILNKKDRKDQVRIGFSMESDINYPIQIPSSLYTQGFDAVATTNPISDVPLFYFTLAQFKPLMKQDFPGFEERAPVAAFVAKNCKAKGRLRLIEELIKLGVKVDSIGTCVAKGSKGIHNDYFATAKKSTFLQKYRVYLALENSQQPGYVSEKIMDGYAAGAVSLYWGAADIAERVPPNSFINANTAMTNPGDLKAVALQLKNALENKQAWEKFFKWKQTPADLWRSPKGVHLEERWKGLQDSTHGGTHLCRMCRRVFAEKHPDKYRFDKVTNELIRKEEKKKEKETGKEKGKDEEGGEEKKEKEGTEEGKEKGEEKKKEKKE
eukprot:TRINITY_DN406_c0_g1_i1.p1 TRINITY_DN406_c0_g1~~TRINITY_DN406_c0_g1_i1.p1  ORF type:complete len:499 (+),score=103.66 TRINITY_DN406_c0_g1_i1:146-1642(+)